MDTEIKSLAPYLILTLNRFEYDKTTFTRNKIIERVNVAFDFCL